MFPPPQNKNEPLTGFNVLPQTQTHTQVRRLHNKTKQDKK